MNVALLSKYSRLGASSRLRSLQFVPVLERYGVSITHLPLFDDAYLRSLYGGKERSLSSMLQRYRHRVGAMRACKLVDLLWIEYEALPYLPFWLERSLMPRGVPYVVDYDDAVFHNYDRSRHALVRSLLGGKIDRVMAGATTVICGNDYLAERARKAGAACIEYVPTVVDASRYGSANDEVTGGRDQALVIGWIGSPATQHYVLDLKPVLERLHGEMGARLVLVGAQAGFVDQCRELPVEVVPWSEEREADAIARFDIGIMPLPDGPWERGKCGYKLIQYMAAGKPVVASPVGVNQRIIDDWECGKLADDEEQWYAALKALTSDVAYRRSLGRRGRDAVETHYSLQVQAPRLARILHRAASGSSEMRSEVGR